MSRNCSFAENEYDTYAIFTQLYDSVHEGVIEDITFYLEEARRGGLVLEVGCGTGRVLIPVAEAGIPVVGIDISIAMLGICQRKIAELPVEVRGRIRLAEADMRDFSFSERFGLIYLPNQTFLSLLTAEDQIRALSNFRAHLRDGGRLAMDFFDPNIRVIGEDLGLLRGTTRTGRVGKSTGDELTRIDNDNKVVHWFKSAWEPKSQIVNHTVIIDELNPGGTVIGRHYMHHVLRWIYRYEFEHLLSRCGFELEGLYSTPDRNPQTQMGQQLFWLARKIS